MPSVLALDLSSKTGWALLDETTKILDHGQIQTMVKDFNVNAHPEKSPSYPRNIIDAADFIAEAVFGLVKTFNPDHIVLENTVKGRNRHTQRLLEFIHLRVWQLLGFTHKLSYMDVSEWRALVQARLTKDDKKNNARVRKGKGRGIVTKKHVSVRLANEIYGLKLKLKDNDVADATLLGRGYVLKHFSQR